MEPKTRQRLVYLAGVLVLVSVVAHLILGILGVVDPALAGADSRLLPIAFLIAALAALGVIWLYWSETIPHHLTFAIGFGLMVLYLLAYVDWHVFEYVESVIPLEAIGLEHDHHHHNGSPLEVLLDHLIEDPFALVSKSAEAIAAIVLAVLAVLEWE